MVEVVAVVGKDVLIVVEVDLKAASGDVEDHVAGAVSPAGGYRVVRQGKAAEAVVDVGAAHVAGGRHHQHSLRGEAKGDGPAGRAVAVVGPGDQLRLAPRKPDSPVSSFSVMSLKSDIIMRSVSTHWGS